MPREHAVIVYGRFQPPTIAHHMVAQKAADMAKNVGGDHIIYGSHSEGSEDNPLSTESKRTHMERVLNTDKIVVDKDIKGIAQVLQDVHAKGYRKITLIAGADRVEGYKKFKQYFGKKTDALDLSNIHPDDFDVVSAGERDPDYDPDPTDMKSVSGTKMRKAADEGDFDTFKSMLPSHVKAAHAKEMMSDVKSGIDSVRAEKEAKKKSKKKLKEEVSATTRMKLAKVARRTAKRRAMIRKIRSRRRKNIPQLKVRAKNEIKSQLRRKVFKGNWKKLSYSQRASIDRMINKRKPMIDSMIKRIMPTVIQGESKRLRNLNSSFDPVVDNFISNFLIEKMVRKKPNREPLDTERKVRRRAKNRVNKRSQRNRDENKRAVGNTRGSVMVVKSKSGDIEIIDKESYNPNMHSVLVKAEDASVSNIQKYLTNKAFTNTVTSERLFGYKEGMGDGKSDKKGKKQVSEPKQKSSKSKKSEPTAAAMPAPMIPSLKKATSRDTFSTSHDAGSMEAGIAYQVNLALGVTPEQMVKNEFIDGETLKSVMSNQHESFSPSCVRAAQVLMKQFPGCYVKHTGRLKKEVKLTDLAKDNKMTDTTPKPDLALVDAASKQMVAGLSQKIGKDTQLGSGGPSEVLTNLKWSRDQLENKLSNKEVKSLNDMIDIIENEMRGNPRTKIGPTSLYLPGGAKEGEDEEVTRRENLHRKVTDKFNDLMNTNSDLRAYFVYASLTGAGKFEPGIGIATHVFSANRDGTDAKVTPISLDYARKISDGGKIKFQATIKSSAVESGDLGKKWKEFEQAKKKAGEKITMLEDFRPYAFRSVLRVFLSENLNRLSGSRLLKVLIENQSMLEQVVPKDPTTPAEAIEYMKDAVDYIGDDAIKMQQFFEDAFDVTVPPILLDFNEYAESSSGITNIVFVNGKEFRIPVEEPYDYAQDGTLQSPISESKRNYRKEYDNYHSKPKQRANRSKRVLARRLMMKLGKVRKGDGKDVDHKDGNPQNNGKHNLRVRPKSENRADNA